jgi:hypothetical protein
MKIKINESLKEKRIWLDLFMVKYYLAMEMK